jgi:CRISPR/Cas system CMR subunit Cmr6 (Cas7 group RAMP superfamily)
VGVDISEEVIQWSQRLMNMNQSKISEQPTKILPETLLETSQPNKKSDNINVNEIKSMIRDVVRDTVRDVVREELKDAGMLVESTQNTNEVIQFKVGQHLFIGKVTKIKKLEK